MAITIRLDYEEYRQARSDFEWDLPDDYNIARDCLRKHPDPAAPALHQLYSDGRRETFSFRELDRRSNQLANGLASLGIERGDRVAVVVPQKPANPLTHLACWKAGQISLPLSVLFGESALAYRLQNSGARAVVADESVLDRVEAVAGECPELDHVLGVGRTPGDGFRFEQLLEDQPESFQIVDTTPDTPASIMYTSGSTGPPKGVLHGHGVWLGHCPGFYMYFERSVESSFVGWTPADWAWIGALGDLVFPAWHYGQPIVGYPMGKFDAREAFQILEEFDVTHSFLPPTAIRMMMEVENPRERYDLALRAICSGGEPLTPEILDWAEEELSGVVVNELYGQTEANLLVANCHDWFEAQPGSMGKPVPGHEVGIIDGDGSVLPRGEVGEIAVRREGDPVVFQQYWRNPEKTDEVTIEGWHCTGDLGYRDEDGYVWFKSRDDDLIITSGYRVGPGEIEKVILEHPRVEQVGVIGVPDATRNEIIKAFVQPVSSAGDLDQLRGEIQQLVRDRLAQYQYPREIEFIEELPQTTTGKIQRSDLRERELEG